jgi:hypothetical protein
LGILFTAAYEWAFWGVIIALGLGIVALFRQPRRDGLILGGAAIVTIIAAIVLTAGHGNQSAPERRLTPKQRLVSELRVTFRNSLISDRTRVLVIRNPNAESVDFYLRCYNRDGSSRTLFVTAPALDTAEVGVFQGWVFVLGEKYEAICDDAVIWRGEVD